MFEKILKGARSGMPGAGGVKHPGMKQKGPDDDLVNVGDSWNGGDGSKEKMHAIPKPPKTDSVFAVGDTIKAMSDKTYRTKSQATSAAQDALEYLQKQGYKRDFYSGAMTRDEGLGSKSSFTIFEAAGQPGDYYFDYNNSVSRTVRPGPVKKNEGWRAFFGI